jgi:hypothetical protein
MFNIFIDPRAAVKVVPVPWSWLWPLLAMSVVVCVTTWLNAPLVLRIMQTNPPGNMTPEQVERALPMIAMTQKISAFAVPIFIGLLTALSAGILSAACAVMDIKSTYRNNFALLAQTLMFGALQVLAGYFVLRLQGDSVQTLAALRPAFGFDLLLTDDASHLLRGVLNYFSIFNVWYILILGLAFAYLTGTSKGKAYGATAPVWILGMIFTVVATLFQR